MQNDSLVRILDIPVASQTLDQAIDTLAAWAIDRTGRRYVASCPVYTLMKACEDPRVRQAIEGADMVTADGMPLVWIQHKRGFKEAERIYGPDVLLSLCTRTACLGVKHFFFGGLPGVAERVSVNLQNKFPGLQIVGTYSPPVGEIDGNPDQQIVECLNDVNPDIIWVGLGSPRQDLWMALYRPHLNAPLLIGVGAAFDYVAGTKRQAPVWMQHNGLEWLFRLCQEPRRLWRRYLIYNPLFIWEILKRTL